MVKLDLLSKSFILLRLVLLHRKSNGILPKILHFGAFEIFLFENFLKPWWKIERDFTHKSFILVRFSALKLKFFFNHGEKLNQILPTNPSFWCVSVLLHWNFLQPWWKIESDFSHKSFILVRFSALKLKFFFNHDEAYHQILPQIPYSGTF